jgi:chaperonin GroES
MANIRPLGDRLVVRRFDAEEKTTGGIVLPDTAKGKSQRGKVLAVGPGKLLKDGTRRGLQVGEGDTILFTAWAGDEFRERDGNTILVMREEDVLAVVD